MGSKTAMAQMAELFGKDRTVIGRHIRNAIDEGEITPEIMCAKFAYVTENVTKVKEINRVMNFLV